MKKFVSVVLALTMVVSMFATASAYQVSDYIDTPETENFLEYQLPIYVRAKKNGDPDTAYKDATEGLEILAEELKTDGVLVDFDARLDMQVICDVFEGDFYRMVSLADDFSTGTVSTDVTVTVEYDKGTVINTEAGSLDSGADKYVQKGERSVTSVSDTREKITINFTQKESNVTVADLVADKNGENKYFSDITFKLPGAVKYTNDGNYNVQVTLTGKTTFGFTSRKVNIGYSNKVATEGDNIGTGNYIVNAATDHKLVIVPAIPATCFDKGTTEGVICDSHDENEWCEHHQVNHNGYNCGINGTVEPQDVDPLVHKNSDDSSALISVAAVPATCAKDGINAHYTCTLCKNDFMDASDTEKTDIATDAQLKDAATGSHSYTEIIPARAKTCTMDGLTAVKQCSVCGLKTGSAVDLATGHNIVIDTAVAATCTDAGKTEGKHCSNPDCTYAVAQIVIPALGHNYGEWVETTPATESSVGEMKRTCIRECGAFETKEIPILPPSHTCAADDTLTQRVEATCTTAGKIQKYCSCGKPFGEEQVIAATGHTTAPKPGKAATCTEKGIEAHYACSTCGKLFRDSAATQMINSAELPINPTAHGDNIITLPAVTATCTTIGRTEGKKCSKCDTVTVAQAVIPNEHKWQEVPAKAATCTDTGVVHHWHCTECNKDFDNDKTTELAIADYTIMPLGHIWGDVVITSDPTDVAEGEGKKTCLRDFNHYETVKIAKKKHIHNEAVYKIVKPATCTEDGLMQKVYTCCNAPYTGADKDKIIEKETAHILKNVAGVAATCTKEGVAAHRHCTICEKNFEPDSFNEMTTVALDKIPHDYEISHDVDKKGMKNECKICHKAIKIKTNTEKADVVHEENPENEKIPGKARDEEADKKLEDDRKIAESSGYEVIPEAELTVDERGLSKDLEDKIQNKDKTMDEKVVLDIVLKANNKVVDNLTDQNVIDQNKQIVSELPNEDEFFIITINIPVGMRGTSENHPEYRIYRMHNNQHTTDDIITDKANNYGEKIISIDYESNVIKIQVRRFSEYVLVAYTEEQPDVVYPDLTPSTTTGGGGGSSTATIKLNTNGGFVLNNVTVKRGQKAELPTPVRDGYVFAGWYLDSSFKTPFDADTVINRNYTLYAKWVELNECRGIAEDNCPCLNYTDLDPTLWYHRGVDYVLNKGMMIGVDTTQFAPDWSTTRAMLVTVLWRAEGKPGAIASTFTDLEEGLYYVDAVNWAVANGVVNGYSDTVFAPNDTITREQFAAIMYRYAKNKGYDVSVAESTDISAYTDYAEISDYAIEAMQYTLGSGLIKGRTETTLNPKDNTTRAEMATILYRFFTESK